jgi:hypothetical protein
MIHLIDKMKKRIFKDALVVEVSTMTSTSINFETLNVTNVRQVCVRQLGSPKSYLYNIEISDGVNRKYVSVTNLRFFVKYISIRIKYSKHEPDILYLKFQLSFDTERYSPELFRDLKPYKRMKIRLSYLFPQWLLLGLPLKECEFTEKEQEIASQHGYPNATHNDIIRLSCCDATRIEKELLADVDKQLKDSQEPPKCLQCGEAYKDVSDLFN